MDIALYSERIFEEIKQVDENGIEFWYARDLMSILEYSKWGNFVKVINKAKLSLENTDITESKHFADVGKTIQMPKNATKEIHDVKLTRYACYLIVQNADPRKKAIALGQRYFAIQTRKQELYEKNIKELSEDDKRLLARESITKENKNLFSSAKNVGVENFGKFNNAGYQGLYDGETAEDIKKRKKLNKKEQILDHMGSTELAANLFRITQTDEVLKRGKVKGESEATQTHFNVGVKVRETMIEISGTKPEELPTPEKSIKEIQKEKRLLDKENKKKLKK
ncbi:DNA damage-inducible protein D [Leptotrichia shahii]|uniref:DNA damage-inducible protein D n=1 Tax=Leptotrichia shahii TaxID=157691 RepID=UPI0028D21E2D|nr:DNA damage-inducible protein D [Leptotrichia shahii]